MPIYEHSLCPVCNREFEADDDVVFCPECGVPHHRECWNSLKHCACIRLHGTDYDFYEDKKRFDNNSAIAGDAPYAVPAVSAVISKAHEAKPETEAATEQVPEQPAPFPTGAEGFNAFFPKEPVATPYDNLEGKIGESSTAEIAAVVRNNVQRFLAVFKNQEDNKKKTGWNWGAFFFGSLYYFYRKMYKQAVSFMCLTAALLFGADLAVAKLAPLTSKAMQEAYMLLANNSSEAAMEKYQSLASVSDYSKAIIITYSFLAVLFIIRIIQAVFADSIYKRDIDSLIKSVTEKLSEGATLQPSVLMNGTPGNLTQEQLKKLYLMRRGGVSIFAPCAAILIMDLIMRIL